MKTPAIVAAIMFISIACTAQAFTSALPFPTETKNKYPKKDKDIIIDDNGNVLQSAKKNGNRGQLPPGQAKKIYGSKSAKEFAPGQQKKSNRGAWFETRRNTNDRRIVNDMSSSWFEVRRRNDVTYSPKHNNGNDNSFKRKRKDK